MFCGLWMKKRTVSMIRFEPLCVFMTPIGGKVETWGAISSYSRLVDLVVDYDSENFAVDHRCRRSYRYVPVLYHQCGIPTNSIRLHHHHNNNNNNNIAFIHNSRQGKTVPRRAAKPAKGKPCRLNSRAVATAQHPRQEKNLTDGQSELVEACTKLQLSPPRGKIPTHQNVLQAMKRSQVFVL